MKILFATVALVTLLSSSAHAQYGPSRGYYGAHAQVPPPTAYRSYGSYGSYRSPYGSSVYNTRGGYIGSDPDPQVRSQLARDPTQGD